MLGYKLSTNQLPFMIRLTSISEQEDIVNTESFLCIEVTITGKKWLVL